MTHPHGHTVVNYVSQEHVLNNRLAPAINTSWLSPALIADLLLVAQLTNSYTQRPEWNTMEWNLFLALVIETKNRNRFPRNVDLKETSEKFKVLSWLIRNVMYRSDRVISLGQDL